MGAWTRYLTYLSKAWIMMSLVLYYKQDRIMVVYWREEIRGDYATGAFATQQR